MVLLPHGYEETREGESFEGWPDSFTDWRETVRRTLATPLPLYSHSITRRQSGSRSGHKPSALGLYCGKSAFHRMKLLTCPYKLFANRCVVRNNS